MSSNKSGLKFYPVGKFSKQSYKNIKPDYYTALRLLDDTRDLLGLHFSTLLKKDDMNSVGIMKNCFIICISI